MPHTPGPWAAKQEGGVWYVDPVGSQNESVLRLERYDQAEANAHLIAAAPVLLDAIEGMCWALDQLANNLGPEDEMYTVRERARDAIAKARGETTN